MRPPANTAHTTGIAGQIHETNGVQPKSSRSLQRPDAHEGDARVRATTRVIVHNSDGVVLVRGGTHSTDAA
jgi:hypothetical protein